VNIARVGKLEHEIGMVLPCSDPECPECTGIHRSIEFDPRMNAYRMATRVGDNVVVDVVAAELFDRQLMVLSAAGGVR
jgi:hypothetical protein